MGMDTIELVLAVEEIWQTLVAIISEQLGVVAEQITPEARFVQHLGAD